MTIKHNMNKNTLLSIASVFCDISKAIIGITLIGTTLFLIHFHIRPSAYNDFKITKPENSSFLKFETENSTGKEQVDFEQMKLTDWKTGSLLFTYFQYASMLILIYLSIHQFSAVLKSVKKLKTFQKTNEIAFRRIGYYCLAIFFLSFLTYWEFGDYSKSNISISFNPLAFALFAFILSEIFKEGNKLKEENELTV